MVHCTYDRLDYVKKVEKVLSYIRENIEKSRDGMIILRLYDVIEQMGIELMSEPLQCQIINLGQALHEKGIHMRLGMYKHSKDILIILRKNTPEDIKSPTEELYKNDWIRLWSE